MINFKNKWSVSPIAWKGQEAWRFKGALESTVQ